MKHRNTFAVLILIALLMAPFAALHAIDVANLRCEYLRNPLGIDAEKPRLSWGFADSKSGIPRVQQQTAYQVLVASEEELLKTDKGDLWDSGKVKSDQSVHLEYAGKPLESRMSCYWKVRIWDQGGKASEWSKPAFWSMGLLKPEDFKAQWITASKWFMPPGDRPLGLIVGAGGWADVDLGESFPIDSIQLTFADTNSSPTRFKILGADEPQFFHPTTAK
jgi:hypothetical protein